jgi:hypothetical protein
MARLFDADAFALQFLGALTSRGVSLREASAQAGVSYSTLSRVQSGWPDLSHENFLKLSVWMHGAATPAAPAEMESAA